MWPFEKRDWSTTEPGEPLNETGAKGDDTEEEIDFH
jgi:hypothetical protein